MIKYCPKCHKEAYRIEEKDDNVKITQGGSTILNISKSSSVSMSISCPSGHPVKLAIKPKEKENGSKEDREPSGDPDKD